jgi:hypothetical protein
VDGLWLTEVSLVRSAKNGKPATITTRHAGALSLPNGGGTEARRDPMAAPITNRHSQPVAWALTANHSRAIARGLTMNHSRPVAWALTANHSRSVATWQV